MVSLIIAKYNICSIISKNLNRPNAHVYTFKPLRNYHYYLKQLSNHIPSPKYNLRSIAFLVVPLALVAFTHLWNPIGYPTVHPDEGYYIGRSIHVSEGLGPKEEALGMIIRILDGFFWEVFSV